MIVNSRDSRKNVNTNDIILLDGNHSVFFHIFLPFYDITSIYNSNVLECKSLLKYMKNRFIGGVYKMEEFRNDCYKMLDLITFGGRDWKKDGVSKYNLSLIGHYSTTQEYIEKPTKFLTPEVFLSPIIVRSFKIHKKYLSGKILNYPQPIMWDLSVMEQWKLVSKILYELGKRLDTWEKWAAKAPMTKFFAQSSTRKYTDPESSTWKQFGRHYLSYFLSYKLGIIQEEIIKRDKR